MARRHGDPDNQHVSEELLTYEGMQKRINKSYPNMATSHRSLLAPVGKVWMAARQDHPDLALYRDHVHPNLLGTYLTACVFCKTLLQENCPVEFDSQLDKDERIVIQSLVIR